MLGNLIVSSVLKSFVLAPVSGSCLRVVAEVDRAVGDRLVHDDAGAVVEHVGDVAQRAQVVLAVSNWPSAIAAKAVYSPSVANSHG